MECDYLAAKEQEKNRHTHKILNLLEPDTWKIEEVALPWQAAEEKLSEFQEVFLYETNINDFRDYVENVSQNFHNYAIPPTTKKAKSITNTIAVNSREAFQ